MDTTLDMIVTEGGIALSVGEGFFVAVPLDGEWVAAFGYHLGDTYHAVIRSDGLAGTYDGIDVAPYIDREEAIEAASEWGEPTVLAEARMAPAT